MKRVSHRMMYMKLDIEGVMMTVISAYAPQVGCLREEKDKFWTDLDEVVETIPKEERLVIGADFNGHVGEGNRGDETTGEGKSAVANPDGKKPKEEEEVTLATSVGFFIPRDGTSHSEELFEVGSIVDLGGAEDQLRSEDHSI